MTTDNFYSLLHTLRGNYAIGIHTWGNCATGCGMPARGSGLCPVCCEIEMGVEIGDPELAALIHTSTRESAEYVNAAVNKLQGEK